MQSTIFWDITPCSSLESTDVSEEHIASIFRVDGLHGVISQRMVFFKSENVYSGIFSMFFSLISFLEETIGY
jgi:hypothetical protein